MGPQFKLEALDTKMGFNQMLLIVAIAYMATFAMAEEGSVASKTGRVLPVLNVITFKNDECKGDKRNGTCYTAEECSNRGGGESGTCAEGFGVCCIFELSCGDSAAENSTYIVQASSTTPTSPCTYTIRPCNENIRRIRFDFTTFVLTSQYQGTADGDATDGHGAIGHCTEDAFSIGSPNGGTPLICGTNTGYHMIVDADEGCHQSSPLVPLPLPPGNGRFMFLNMNAVWRNSPGVVQWVAFNTIQETLE